MDSIVVLEVCDSSKGNKSKENFSECTLESLISLCVYKFCDLSNVPLRLKIEKCETEKRLKLNEEDFQQNVIWPNELPWQITSCKLPTVFADSTIITGLCAVSRYLCKCRTAEPLEVEHPKGILGFRSGCLQAPNEVSVWTKFCEIEILETTNDLLENMDRIFCPKDNATFVIPHNLARFEKHLKQPLRVHNVYKVARDVANKSYKAQEAIFHKTDPENPKQGSLRSNVKYRNWKSKNKPIFIDSSTPIDDLQLEHLFAEGPYLTLADLILYPCYFLIFSTLGSSKLKEFLPKTHKWFENLKSLLAFKSIDTFLSKVFEDVINLDDQQRRNITYVIPEVQDVSLYKCDPKRSNPKKRLYTKEMLVKCALDVIGENTEVLLKLSKSEANLDGKIDWLSIPPDVNPNGGHLPDKRTERKSQQLENMALAVMKLARPGHRIIDFCSGSGHLGILLAYLLPQCTIVLLENKEESLNRAKARVKSMGFKNIFFFQCNLDYFIGDFDIGVALHACGIATDLVLENCIKKNASFVVCPCCYGSLHVTERLLYPRSQAFSVVPLDRYMCIGHAADQTHVDHPMEERGGRCMMIIDSDRARHAMDHGYTVELSRLKPLSCTPKNMLIVGISSTYARHSKHYVN